MKNIRLESLNRNTENTERTMNNTGHIRQNEERRKHKITNPVEYRRPNKELRRETHRGKEKFINKTGVMKLQSSNRFEDICNVNV